MGFRLAELFVDITANDKQVTAGLGRVHSALDGLVGRVAALAGTAGVGYMLFDATKKAALLNEEISRTNVVLGSSSDVVIKRAEQMADAFGTAKAEYIGAATSFASAMKGAGMNASQAADAGTILADLATDMRSFNPGTTFSEAAGALQAALRGEFDPLERFNVFLSQSKIEAEALALGIIKSKDQMNDLAKRTAVMSLLMKQTTDQVGDRARTADSPWNRLEEATGRFQNALVTLGQNFTPIMGQMAATASETLGGINTWLASNTETISGWVKGVGEGLGLVGWGLQNMGGLWQVAGLYAAESLTNIEELASWAFGAIGQYGDWFANNWVNLFRDAVKAAWTIFENVFTNIKDLGQAVFEYITTFGKSGFNFVPTNLLDGFEATVGELPKIAAPHLSNLRNEIDAVWASMADGPSNQMAGGIAPGKDPKALMADLVAQQQGAMGGKSEQARTSSLEGFASKLIEGAFGDKKHREQMKALNAIAANTDPAKAGVVGGAAGAIAQ